MRPLIRVGGRGTPLGNCKVAFATSCPAAGTVSSAPLTRFTGLFQLSHCGKMEQLSWHFGALIWRGERKKSPSFVCTFFSTELLD